MKTEYIKHNAKEIIKNVVDDFKSRHEELTKKNYKEDRVRKDFIDKFFNALGWDMYNEKKLHENQREVIHEDVLRIKGKAKAPDYAFRIGRSRKFYVEAKAPWIDLENAKEPAYQVRLYGYNRKLPISILTDFEEFCIYDTKYPPKHGDNTTIARIFYCRFDEYLDKYNEICSWCSKDALYDNESQYYKFAKKKIKKGELSVDDNFLKFLSKCRNELAINIANRNKEKHFDEKQFNHIVQIIIDRIIFLRITEDRAIEEYQSLLALTKNNNIYDELKLIFEKCEGRYNSSLFLSDYLIENITVDDLTLKHIIKGLYYPNPYEFSVMPVEIIGSIYEQFLGSVIRVLHAGGVKVHEKPEVQKAGGVYYTPEYIVQYIIENTLGSYIKKKKPEDISNIKVLDPACGSGSFLIGAYDYLLNWHIGIYTKNVTSIKAAKKKGLIYEVIHEDSETKEKYSIYKLSVEEKRRILINNIHGVDIDPQAVEVTKLSLVLKMLEDENYETKDTLFQSIGIAILPNLSKDNIKCGNSLISSDYYSYIRKIKTELNNKITKAKNKDDKKLINDLENMILKIDDNNPNPFDWIAVGELNKKDNEWLGRGFPEILSQGGFDIIVGNPPYVKARDYDENKEIYRDYLNNYSPYNTLYKMWDLYIPFIEKSVSLLKEGGSFGMIIPDTIEKSDYASVLREWLLTNFNIYQIDFFPDSKIFISKNKIVGITNTILYVSNTPKSDYVKRFFHDKEYTIVKKSDIVPNNIDLFSQFKSEINFNRTPTIPLGHLCFTSYGLRLNSDKSDKNTFKKADLLSFNQSKVYCRKYTEGKYISRYKIDKTLWVEYNTNRCPTRLVRPTFKELYEPEKLLLGRQTKVATLDNEKYIVDNTIIICLPYIKLKNVENRNIIKYFSNMDKSRIELEELSKNINLKVILGIINSKLITQYILFLKQNAIDMYPDDWKKIPIPIMDDTNKLIFLEIASLVTDMIDAQKSFNNPNLTKEQRNMHKMAIDSLNAQIDDDVYNIFGLTKDEIDIIKIKVN